MTYKPTPTTDLLKRCAEIHEWLSTGVLSGEALRDYAKRKWPDLRDTLQMAEHETVTEALALLAKWGQPAQAGEPVAWVWRFSDGSFCETPFETRKACAQDSIGYEGEPVPLYLAPQPVAREPLSDEQIEALPMWKRFVGLWPETRREIVRIIEAHHGIKGGQHVE